MSRLIDRPRALRYHGGAVGSALLAYGFGIAGLFNAHWATNLAATILEWFYIPARELILHFMMVFPSFLIPHGIHVRVKLQRGPAQ